jgi:hypothetical protein
MDHIADLAAQAEDTLRALGDALNEDAEQN